MSRRSRFLASLVALLALLFAQLAVAAYDCPQLKEQRKAERTCDHDITATPNLCIEHCAYGEASLGSAKPAPSAPDLPGIPVTASPEALPAFARVALRVPASATPPPPLIARFTVLRI